MHYFCSLRDTFLYTWKVKIIELAQLLLSFVSLKGIGGGDKVENRACSTLWYDVFLVICIKKKFSTVT